MQKDTSKIVEELGLCPDFQTFYKENKDYMISGNLAELLSQLLESKGLKKHRSSKNLSFPMSTVIRSSPVSASNSAE